MCLDQYFECHCCCLFILFIVFIILFILFLVGKTQKLYWRIFNSWWISKMQSDTLEERYAIKFCFKLGKNATETYGMLHTAFRPSCMNRDIDHYFSFENLTHCNCNWRWPQANLTKWYFFVVTYRTIRSM